MLLIRGVVPVPAARNARVTQNGATATARGPQLQCYYIPVIFIVKI
jgi:hypothetical protein